MVHSSAFTTSNGFPLGVWPRARLRLQALRRFKAFSASSARQSCASSYGVGSVSLCFRALIHHLGLTRRSSRPPSASAYLVRYKGFPPLASNTSPWVCRAATHPGMVFIGFSSASNLVHAARRCFLANGADGVTTNGHCAALLLAANPDERRAPGAPFVSRASGFLPWLPQSSPSIPRRRSNPLHINDCLHAADF